LELINFILLIFVIILTSQYNLHFLSVICILIYSLFETSFYNLFLIIIFIIVLYFTHAFSSTYLIVCIILAIIIIIASLIGNHKSQSSGGSGGMEDFAKLFGGDQ